MLLSYLVETGFPLHSIQCLQIMYKEGPLEVSEGLHPNLPPSITAQPGHTCRHHFSVILLRLKGVTYMSMTVKH